MRLNSTFTMKLPLKSFKLLINFRSALQYFNERSLEDEDFAINFALLFTSCHFDGLREHLQSSDGNSIFRAHILNMLQQNYSSEYNDRWKPVGLLFVYAFSLNLFIDSFVFPYRCWKTEIVEHGPFLQFNHFVRRIL